MLRHQWYLRSMTKKETLKQQGILSTAHFDFQKGLNARAFFKLNDHQTGEDMVQDTFMKTWAYLVKGGKIDVMKAFLYHILNNLIVDEYRKRKHTSVSLDVLLEKGFEPSITESHQIMNVMDGERALLLVKNLPAVYQKVIRMRYVQDLSLKEMALLTGQTKNAMAVQVHRGLEKLKVLYNRT